MGMGVRVCVKFRRIMIVWEAPRVVHQDALSLARLVLVYSRW